MPAAAQRMHAFKTALAERDPRYRHIGAASSWNPDGTLRNADPSFLRKAKNFQDALTRHAADGFRKVELPAYQARRRTCDGCEYLDRDRDTCRHRRCGCNLNASPIPGLDGKLWWASESCPMRKWLAVPKPGAVAFPLHFDHTNLFPEIEGRRFNSSILEWNGGYLLAFRTGWEGSQIHVARLDANLKPLDCRRLKLQHSRCGWGREDPRLFVHGNHVHCMFIGVTGRRGPTHVLFCRLSETLEVEDLFSPKIVGRRSWEKNHSYFDHDGRLYAVYDIVPHKILRIDSNEAAWVYETPGPRLWTGGHMRGGAAPVRVGDEYWCFFHGKTEQPLDYNVGLYAFEARPPFRLTRCTPDPILRSDPATKPADQYCPVVFPCGAARRGDEWLLSCGIHDRWTEIHAFDHDELESLLEPT